MSSGFPKRSSGGIFDNSAILPLALALQEKFGGDWPWRHNVYGNIAASQFVRQDVHQVFDSGLRALWDWSFWSLT